MKKICNWLLCNLDKAFRVAVYIIITIALGLVFLHTTAGINAVAAAGCGICGALVVGVLEKVVNFIKDGKFSVSDIIADAFGGIIGFLLSLLIL